MPNDDRTSGLIGRIYDAAADPAIWPDVLKALADDLGGMAGVLVASDPKTGEGRKLAAVGLDPDYVASYAARYAAVDPWTERYAALPLGAVVSTDQFLPRAELAKTEFYADWLRPQGIVRSLGAVVLREDRAMIRLGLPRTGKQGPYGEEDIARLRVFVPHLRRALSIGRRLNRVAAERSVFADAIERLPIGVVLLDRDCHVVYMNPAADAIVAARDGFLVTREGLLTVAGAGDNRALQQRVAEAALAAGGGDETLGGVFKVLRPSGRRAYEALVAPPRETGLPLAAPPMLLLIGDPGRAVDASAGRLARLYGLSPAEARLARGIANGRRLGDLAGAAGVTRETERGVLKRALRKTATHRQAELAALLLKGLASLY